MKTLFAILAFALTSTAASAQTVLSLNEAIAIGLEHNRNVANAALQVEKADQDVAVAKTKRLPNFKIEAQASQLLRPIDLTFARGAFGTLPGIGPVPDTDATVRTPARMNVVFDAQATQPITQLHKLNLSILLNEASRGYQREQLRDTRIALVNEIRRLYYGIAQTKSALAANTHTLDLLDELGRVVERRVVSKVALKSDALTVDSRMAQAQLARLSLEHTMAAQKEQLNLLLGRDVRTRFDVADVPPMTLIETDLESAQARALDARPDVKQARIKLQQAELARRVAKADYIPDVGLTVSYISPLNIDGAPRQIATAAIQAQWEPFDWGRKGRALATKSLDIQQARNAVRDAEDRVVLDVNARYRRLDEARAQLGAARVAQDAARETARVKVAQYDARAALLADVLQTEASLADSNNQLQQALAAFWVARADFERALGEDIAR
jgi:outer membrane protein TolC